MSQATQPDIAQHALDDDVALTLRAHTRLGRVHAAGCTAC